VTTCHQCTESGGYHGVIDTSQYGNLAVGLMF
jgi:hypothetical protein